MQRLCHLPPFCFTTTFASTRFFSRSSGTHLNIQQKQSWLVSILLEHSTSRQMIQQVHSHSITTSLLLYQHHSMQLLFNHLLRCYALGPFPHEAFFLFKHYSYFLSLSSFDSFTFSFLLRASSALPSTFSGLQLHALILKLGFHYNVYVHTALLHMYAACGSLLQAAPLFYKMPLRNAVTSNIFISALINWGHLEFASSLFHKMPDRTVVSWTTIIDGYIRFYRPAQALVLFRQMLVQDDIKPSEITILAILPATYYLGTLDICQCIHTYAEKFGFNASNIRVATSLIDTYAKCGCIYSASRVFEDISPGRRNLVSWTSIISGFAMHGMAKEAVKNFERMEKVCLKPNQITFLSVLNACSHGGLVEEGLKFFKKMIHECELVPDIKHYGCIIDMLGRVGRLEEAEKTALEIPSEIFDVVIWRTLLGACSFHGNAEIGERVLQKALEMERGYGADYVQMSKIFSGAGRFRDAERLRRVMNDRNVCKVPAHSLVRSMIKMNIDSDPN